jgi:ribosome biogenesis protein MAK21
VSLSPYISLLTRQSLTAQPLTATGADLSQNTLSHFLDRFVYKNPKKKAPSVEGKGKGVSLRGKIFSDILGEWFVGASAMQPARSAVQGGRFYPIY